MEKIKEKEIHLKYFPTFDDLKNKVNEIPDIFDNAKMKFFRYLDFIMR